MKVNERTVKKIVNVLEKSCSIITSNVRIMPDTGESDFIIRYEDGNGITISIYFSTQYEQTCVSVGFIDHDERYKTFSTTCRIKTSYIYLIGGFLRKNLHF